MAEPLTWEDGRRKLSELKPRADNPRYIDEDAELRLVRSYEEYDQPWPMLINPDGTLIDGHQRLKTWIEEYGPDFEVDVRIPSRPLTQKEWQKLAIYGHKGAVGKFDFQILADWGIDEDLLDWGFEAWELGTVEKIELPQTGGDGNTNIWQGMPEFEQEDLTPIKTLKVHFAAQEDIIAFAKLVKQKITDKTKFIWYPEAEIIPTGKVISES